MNDASFLIITTRGAQGWVWHDTARCALRWEFYGGWASTGAHRNPERMLRMRGLNIRQVRMRLRWQMRSSGYPLLMQVL